MRRIAAAGLFLIYVTFIALATGCEAPYVKYTDTFFGTFDTVVVFSGYARQKGVFDRAANRARVRLTELHRIYDAFNEYEGLSNLATVNREAGLHPVKAPAELIELIAYCKRMQKLHPGTANIALGGALALWHDYRERGIKDPANAQLPPMAELREAAAHADLDSVILDAEAGTIFFADPKLKLDVGSVAKGYAVELLALEMAKSDMPSFLINAGGNIRAGLPPMDRRDGWRVGVENPDLSNPNSLAIVSLKEASLVTSGDYHRYYVVEGVRYHHIIDPQTLFPPTHLRAVTILTPSSADADFLTTVLFILPYERGRALIDSLPETEALWVLAEGEVEMSGGMKRAIIQD